MTLRSELMQLKDTAGNGVLHASDVVDWAEKNPDSALHGSFQWDDPTAAREYRLQQARQLIQLHIRDERGQPLMVSLTIDRPNGGGYRQISDVLPVPNLRQMLLTDALEELDRVKARFEQLTELVQVWEQAAAVRQKAAKPKAKAAKKAKPPPKPTPRRGGGGERRPSA